MAITSIGYPETIEGGAGVALWHAAAGRPYVFPAENQLRPNNPQSGTRRVTLSTGRFSGKGITDYNDATVNLDLPTPSGSKQYFAIVANRWVDAASTPSTPVPSGELTRLGWVAGTSSRAIPAVTQVPGTLDQQLVALALVESGEQYIRELVDLRAIGEEGGVYTVFDDLALQTVRRPGARAYNAITKRTYECRYTAAKALEWELIGAPNLESTNIGSSVSGWSTGNTGLSSYAHRTFDGAVSLRLASRSGSVRRASDSSGGFTDMHVFTLDPSFRPRYTWPITFKYYTPTGSTYGGFGEVRTGGEVVLQSGAPGADIRSVSSTGTPGASIIVSAMFPGQD